jgi:hypothetical protein
MLVVEETEVSKFSISGSPVTYAGGGGGGVNVNAPNPSVGTGGTGGGGTGGKRAGAFVRNCWNR